MVERNFSMQTYWERVAKDWQPLLRFKGKTQADWQSWLREAYPKFMELLGDFPRAVPLEAEVEYSIEDGDLIRERVVFQSEEHMSVPCIVLRPKSMKADGSNAAILCSHGHGHFGKEPIMGVRSSPEHESDIALMNYNYGEQMAHHGYLTIAPDLRAWGERADPWRFSMSGDYYCDAEFVKGALMGIYMLSRNIWDMKCCLDYLETRPEVDKNRLGMMGLSQGGTMTTFTSAAEPRIKAADIMCYVNPFGEFGVKQWLNLCGSQLVPNLYRYLDTDDIAGLIAPRPLLMEMGMYDNCFLIKDTLVGYEGVKRIYAAAGVPDRLWADIFPGPHSWGANKSVEFFAKYL
jgi:hypothetical protein